MKPIYTIKELEQVKVLTHPLRLRIIEFLIDEPRTTRQVADLLEDKPSNLYYHFNQLEDAGLIEVVKTRQKGNLLEKYYRTVASEFVIDRSLFRIQGHAFQEMVETILEATGEEITKSLQNGKLIPEKEGNHLTIRKQLRGNREEIEAFYQKLEDLRTEAEKLAQGSEGEETYGLTLLFYPEAEREAK